MNILIQSSKNLVLTKEEIQNRIPLEKLNQIKGSGVLQAYTIAQEGKSYPKVLGEGTQILKWTKAVLHRLKDKIKQGTKFFVEHGNDTNSHTNREAVGEIVSSFLKDIHGKLSNVIVGYFPDRDKVKNEDVCSMEADIYTDENNIVGDINDVTGIALGKSSEQNPGFSGAIRLATVQCFEEPNYKSTGQQNNSGEGDKTMADKITFEDVKKAVREMNIFPWQIYTKDDLIKDKVFGEVFTEKTTLLSENERLTKVNEDLEKNNKESIRRSQVMDANKKLETLMLEGFTDKQKQFIKDQFNPDTQQDLTDDGLSKFIEQGKKNFSKTAKLFGVAEESDTDKGDKNKQTEELTTEEEALKLMGA